MNTCKNMDTNTDTNAYKGMGPKDATTKKFAKLDPIGLEPI